jgi:hypothetical protein
LLPLLAITAYVHFCVNGKPPSYFVDIAREGRPSVWIFEGKSVVFLVCGVAAFIALFRILAACDLDWLLLIWRTKAWLYFCGALDRPPVLWAVPAKPKHPHEF